MQHYASSSTVFGFSLADGILCGQSGLGFICHSFSFGKPLDVAGKILMHRGGFPCVQLTVRKHQH